MDSNTRMVCSYAAVGASLVGLAMAFSGCTGRLNDNIEKTKQEAHKNFNNELIRTFDLNSNGLLEPEEIQKGLEELAKVRKLRSEIGTNK